MARKNDSQRDTSTPSRVYKSSDVHKRRVDRKGREKVETRISEPPKPEDSMNAASDAPDRAAVVITPEFGKRTAAQREADDRWFAAMREADAANAGADAPDGGLPDGGSSKSTAAPANNTVDIPAVQDAVSAPDAQRPSSGSSAGENAAAQLTQKIPVVSDEKGQPEQSGPAESGQEQPDQAERDDSEKKNDTRPRPSVHAPATRKGRIALIVAAVVLVAVIAAALLFAWNRWYRFDDHADMQGSWYVVGTAVPVTIDETAIHLTDDVTYQYEINAQDKTIRYTFGPMEGQGRYWLSDDRQYLVITDGDEFTSAGTAFDDLLHMFSDMGDRVTGSAVKLPEGEGIIAFSREPDADALEKQRAEAEAKAKAEEAARKEAERQAAEQAAAEAAEAEQYYYYEEERAEETPAEGGQAEGAPANETPAEGGAAEESHVEGAPAQEASGEG